MSKYTLNSIGVDVCVGGSLLLDKRLCVKCELRRKGITPYVGLIRNESEIYIPMVCIIGEWMYINVFDFVV